MKTAPTLLDRLPPHDPAAERSVLGSMLRSNACIDELTWLRPEDFYADAHQKLHKAIAACRDGGRPVDTVLLAEALKSRGWLEDAGGYAALAELWDAAPTAANVRHYAKIVRDKALLRGLIAAGTELLAAAYHQSAPAGRLVEDAERALFALRGQDAGRAVTLAEAVDETVALIAERAAGRVVPLMTGLRDLDELTQGVRPGELVVIAARPAVGKTSVLLALARHFARQGRTPHVASLEQSRVELVERMLAAEGDVRVMRLRTGKLDDDDRARLSDAAALLRRAGMLVDDRPRQTVRHVAAQARRAARGPLGLGAVLVDYLQIVEPDDRRKDRREQVGQVARDLKAAARELGVPLVALAQLNRESENRADRKPRLADLREAGEIEQEADLVVLLHRPHPDADEQRERDRHDLLDLLVAKNRNGRTGEESVYFRRALMRFEDLPRPKDRQAWDDPAYTPFGQ